MIKDKFGNQLKVNDMVKFHEDRYSTTLGIIEEITESQNLWIKVCGGGGTGNRLVVPSRCKKVEGLND